MEINLTSEQLKEIRHDGYLEVKGDVDFYSLDVVEDEEMVIITN